MSGIVESEVEDAALEWFEGLGWQRVNGPDIAPGGVAPERSTFGDVILLGRLERALLRLNPDVPRDALDEALRRVVRREHPTLIAENEAFHWMLVDGLNIPVRYPDGTTRGALVRLINFDDFGANDFAAVNQFTVHDGEHHRRPDIVAFVNGIPLGVIELKNAGDENATVDGAFNQLQTYKAEIPSLFVSNELLVASDGMEARAGSITADRERFVAWKTVEGRALAPVGRPQLQVLIQGLFQPERFLRFVRHFVVYEDEGRGLLKKLAGYHQYHAVEQAVTSTVEATGAGGDRKVGVVWHTQGSGKSLTMVFYAGRLALELDNPTLVVITDRNDLDDQLFGTFSRCRKLIRQTPEQADSRADLRDRLRRASGGVVFTTIQKFGPAEGEAADMPVLSDRRNIIVIADEAHRSQYGFAAKVDPKTGALTYGLAKYLRDALPHASFIGFTGTPIELTDANTREVFGDYIDVYDIQQAVDDGATVPIYYESRLARLELKPDERPHLDTDFEEVTEGEELTAKEKLKSRWAQLEAIVGSEKRLALVAKDLVEHFERRQEAMEGKAMVVAMSRRIAVAVFDEIVRLRPEWDDPDETKGAIKVVMTGSAADDPSWQRHIRSKEGREKIAGRFKNPADPLKLVIVRDMWLTGFDVPSLHTMYVDKPMHGHTLMQAIARVNRVFRDKPGGLVVDYLGLAEELRSALSTYTESGGKGSTAQDIGAEAIAKMKEQYEVVCDLFHGFDWRGFARGSGAQRLEIIGSASEHVLGLEDGKDRYDKAVAALSLAFALCAASDEAARIRDDVAFFQAVRAVLTKRPGGSGKTTAELDHAIRQILSNALVSEEVVDIFKVAGLDKPDISILSDEFLLEVQRLPKKNLAVELLSRLLNDEIRVTRRQNVVQARVFSEMLDRALKGYHNRSIETAKVISELIEMAKEMQAARDRGEKLGMSPEEVAFFDALAQNESAVDVLGNDQLMVIAREVVATIRANLTIDWTLKDSVQANLRRLVRRVLGRYGYPPDLQQGAVALVMEQARVMAEAEVAA